MKNRQRCREKSGTKHLRFQAWHQPAWQYGGREIPPSKPAYERVGGALRSCETGAPLIRARAPVRRARRDAHGEPGISATPTTRRRARPTTSSRCDRTVGSTARRARTMLAPSISPPADLTRSLSRSVA